MTAHRFPQNSSSTIGPWSSTARFLGAVNLGVAVMIAAGGLIGLFAAARPDLGLAGPLGVAGWIVVAVVVVVLVLTGQVRRHPDLAGSTIPPAHPAPAAP